MKLAQYQNEFIEFMLGAGVLRFGEFITKSGRTTPYFINTGHYDNGRRLRLLGQYYAMAIHSQLGFDFDILYGPAYKGIPLATATAIALDDAYGQNVPVLYNRKEAKDHGEGGQLIGRNLVDGDRVLIIDDVITAGTSVRESADLLAEAAKVELAGLIVSVDRQEKGSGERSALDELAEELNLKAASIVNLDQILVYLREREAAGEPVIDSDSYQRIEAYRQTWGA